MADNSSINKFFHKKKDILLSFLKIKSSDLNFYIIGFFIIGTLAIIQNCSETKSEPTVTTESSDSLSADTFIPPGKVLVPIEIVNAESLEGLIGNVGGVVDLFTTSPDGSRKNFKIGDRLKILKAPLNPRQFAVLIDEESSSQILQHQGPFFAVIQNPQQKSGTIKKQERFKKSRNIEVIYPQLGNL